MRVFPALATSVIAHLALFGLVRTLRPGVVIRVPAPRVGLSEPAPIDVMPIEVVVLPPAGAAPRIDPDEVLPVPLDLGTARASASRRSSGTEVRGGTDAGASGRDDGTGSRHLPPMRGHERTPFGIDGDALARIANERPDEAVLPPPESGKLAPSGGGTMIAPDLAVPMQVDPDGRPHFDGGGDGEIHVIPPTSAHQLGDLLDAWYKDPYAQTASPPLAEMPQHEQAVPGGWDSGGRPGSLTGEGTSSNTVPLVGGGFDITSWAMKKAGIDPYRARKQKLLEATYEERTQMRTVHTADQLRRASELMQQNLRRLWRKAVDPADRRRALFELWDECEEGTGAAGDAGTRARRQVLGWIRAHLPAGSTDAYSVDEITALNANRQSTQAFAPY